MVVDTNGSIIKRAPTTIKEQEYNVVIVPEETMESDQHEVDSSLPGTIGSLVRWVSESIAGSKTYEKELLRCLRKSTSFRYCSERSRLSLANCMEMEVFKKGDVLMMQGEPQTSAIVVVQGQVARLRLVDDQLHHMAPMGSSQSESTIGMLHLIREEKTFATVRALTDGIAYRLHADTYRDLLEESPEFSQDVIFSLCREIRAHSKLKRTPLFLQSGKALPAEPLPWFAVSCAAAIESFYRSGLNAYLNAQLSNTARGPLFPNMHIQLPTRVLYINGFKGLRHVLDSRVHLSEFENPQLAGVAMAILPGLTMTPISSVLEACNAGELNPEALAKRWTRGLAPRCAREVIFGIGINQLSDFCEERMELFDSKTLNNMGGSLVAGLCAGYLSHVPHNLSTLKLLNPKKSYAEHFKSLQQGWYNWFDNELMSGQKLTRGQQTLRRFLVPTLSCVFPKGSIIRSCQIAGSFIIINATVNSLSHINVNVSVSRTPSTS